MPWDPAPATTSCQPSGSAARAEGRDLQVAVAEFCACAPCLLRKIAPQSVRLVCRWDDGDKRSIHRTGKHTKLWHARESSNRGRSMGSYSPYCVEEEFSEVQGSNLQSPKSRDSASAGALGATDPHAGEHRPFCSVDS